MPRTSSRDLGLLSFRWGSACPRSRGAPELASPLLGFGTTCVWSRSTSAVNGGGILLSRVDLLLTCVAHPWIVPASWTARRRRIKDNANVRMGAFKVVRKHGLKVLRHFISREYAALGTMPLYLASGGFEVDDRSKSLSANALREVPFFADSLRPSIARRGAVSVFLSVSIGSYG